MQLLVVILNYRTPELVIDCLSSMVDEVLFMDGVHVVVLDNASGDQSCQKIQSAIEEHEWSTWCELREAKVNGGFSAGNNRGMEFYEASFYLLLNSDTIVHPGALSELLKRADECPHAGMVGPKILQPDGSVDDSVFRMPRPLSELVRGAHLSVIDRMFRQHVITDTDSSMPTRGMWLSFAAVLLRGETFKQVGPMDEGFFMYFEDIDYGHRVEAAEWEIAYAERSQVTHLGGGSSADGQAGGGSRPRGPRYFYEARARYFCKHYGIAGLWCANILWTLGKGLSLIRQVTSGRPSHCRCSEARDIWIRSLRPLRPPSIHSKGRAT